MKAKERVFFVVILIIALCVFLKLSNAALVFYMEFGTPDWSCERCFERSYRVELNPLTLCQDPAGNHAVLETLYVISSRAEDTKLRALFRRSILSFTDNNRHPSSRHVFVVGASLSVNVQQHLLEESRKHGDILQQDFTDTYHNLTLKVMAAFEWAVKYCWNALWLVKVDDDLYFDVNQLLYIQRNVVNGSNYLVGSCFREKEQKPERRVRQSVDEKLVIPKSFYPYRYLPPYCRGGLYMMTLTIARDIVSISEDTPYFPLEDAYIGLCLLRTNYTVFDIPKFMAEIKPKIHPTVLDCDFASKHVSVHKLSPVEIADAWDRCSHIRGKLK